MGFSGTALGQMKYSTNKSHLFCHDTVNHLDYTFDSGAEISSYHYSDSLPELPWLSPTRISFALVRDALGNLKLHRKVKAELYISGLGKIHKKIVKKEITEPCFNNYLMLGMDVVMNKVVGLYTTNQTINFNAVPPKNLGDYMVLPMRREWLTKAYYVQLYSGKKRIKCLVDLGYIGAIAFKKPKGLSSQMLDPYEGWVTTFSAQDVITNFDVYRNQSIKTNETDPAIISDIMVSKNLTLNLLGLQFFLRYDTVYFDFKNGFIYLKGDNTPPREIPLYNLSFRMGEFIINGISRNSKEYSHGFRVGEKVNVHGIDISSLSATDLCNFGRLYWGRLHQLGESVVFIEKKK